MAFAGAVALAMNKSLSNRSFYILMLLTKNVEYSKFIKTMLLTTLTTRGVSVLTCVNDLLNQAIEEANNLNSGEIFLVKDLFKGYVWKRIPVKDRLLLGTLFLNYVNTFESSICATEKTSSNQQRYEKL